MLQMIKKIASTLFLSFSLISICGAQITIAPTNLFIDNQNKFGTYMVINNSETPQEVSVDFFFGYNLADENGNREQIMEDTTRAKLYSVVDYVRAFPQNFVLQPGQRQIVRLRITAPNNLEERTYWARIKTTSSAQSPPLEVASNSTVSANVGINIEQITGLFYKNGSVSTNIDIEEIRTRIEDQNLVILADYTRTGNSPFLGSITTKLIDSNNKVVAENFVSTSIYFDGTHSQVFDISSLPSGNYQVDVRFVSRRSDISPEEIIQMEPENLSKTISIP